MISYFITPYDANRNIEFPLNANGNAISLAYDTGVTVTALSCNQQFDANHKFTGWSAPYPITVAVLAGGYTMLSEIANPPQSAIVKVDTTEEIIDQLVSSENWIWIKDEKLPQED